VYKKCFGFQAALGSHQKKNGTTGHELKAVLSFCFSGFLTRATERALSASWWQAFT